MTIDGFKAIVRLILKLLSWKCRAAVTPFVCGRLNQNRSIAATARVLANLADEILLPMVYAVGESSILVLMNSVHSERTRSHLPLVVSKSTLQPRAISIAVENI